MEMEADRAHPVGTAALCEQLLKQLGRTGPGVVFFIILVQTRGRL